MEPLFTAVICGCNAGLFREALQEVYIPRIQRGNAYYAANALGARGPLLSALVHFFEDEHWGVFVEPTVEGQSLTSEDQLFILMQAALYLSATRGLGASEIGICYNRAEILCQLLNRPLLLSSALIGQWRHILATDKVSTAMHIAERAHSLAHEDADRALMILTYNALAATHYFSGNFESVRQCAMHAVQIWRSGGVQSNREDIDTPVVGCLCYEALSEWHLGEISSSHSHMDEAVSLAKELKDWHALAGALNFAAGLYYLERKPAEVERLALEGIELSTRHNFAMWLAIGIVYRGWTRSVSGDTAQGIAWIEQGIRDYRATGAVLTVPMHLARKAEALHLADRTSEALEAIYEAEALAERFEHRLYLGILHRLHGVFLAAIDGEDTRIEASFSAAIRIGKRAEVGFAGETRRSNLRGIPSPKSERVRRMWIPTTSLVTFYSALPLFNGQSGKTGDIYEH
jgi:hypothetical protein